MEKSTFEKFRSIVYRESGIVLPPEKISLLTSRIQKRILALGLQNELEYLKIIELDVDGNELVNLIDVVSTNVTHFYREAAHFKVLQELLTNWRKEGRKDFKIWCAAASSGEEPYTIAFESFEALGSSEANFKILASDICTKVLKKAIAAVYPESLVDKIPDHIRNKYMQEFEHEDSTYWRVKETVCKTILFKKLNLVSYPYPIKGPFDIIFCRNVMIYFDVQTRQKIINEFSRLLRPGGVLFLSHSESLVGINHTFRSLNSSVFQKEQL